MEYDKFSFPSYPFGNNLFRLQVADQNIHQGANLESYSCLAAGAIEDVIPLQHQDCFYTGNAFSDMRGLN